MSIFHDPVSTYQQVILEAKGYPFQDCWCSTEMSSQSKYTSLYAHMDVMTNIEAVSTSGSLGLNN